MHAELSEQALSAELSEQALSAERNEEVLSADRGQLTSELRFEGPLEWDAMLHFLRARAIPGVEEVTDAAYRRTFANAGARGVIELRREHPNQLTLRARMIAADRRSGACHFTDAAVIGARQLFALDAPIAQAALALAHDPLIGTLIRARPGLRVPGAFDAFEIGVRAIIGQQVSVAGASTIIGRLVSRLGEPLERIPPAGVATAQARPAPAEHGRGRRIEPPGLSRTFPPAETVADADLDGLGMPGARARAIRGFAQAVASGEIPLGRTATLAQLTQAITRVRGLGPWTAQYIALRLGQRDAFPATDLGLRHAIERLRPGAGPQLAKLAQRWSPWRATAAIHLWNAPAG